MKNLINAFLTGLVNIALHGYFRKMIVQGKENIPKNVPIILVANHQNALIDPLLIATQSKLKPWFLTRASAFKKPLVAKLLNFIRMLPVFRVRDGFSTITQNQQTFDQTYEVLKANGTVIIFAEGTHHLERNLFPLSKGFTRMAFGLKEHFPEKEPVILPVGINYSAHQKSGSIVRMSFGECIPVNMTSAQSGKLTKSVERALKELIVEIPNEGYEESLKNLIENGIDLSNKNEIEAFLNQGRIPEK